VATDTTPTVQRVAVFEQRFSGPRAGQDTIVAALQGAGFDTRSVEHPYATDPQERGTVWIVAEQATGEAAHVNDQQTLMARAAPIANRYGYRLRMHGVAWAWRQTEGT
jgi:hypothetical protein